MKNLFTVITALLVAMLTLCGCSDTTNTGRVEISSVVYENTEETISEAVEETTSEIISEIAEKVEETFADESFAAETTIIETTAATTAETTTVETTVVTTTETTVTSKKVTSADVTTSSEKTTSKTEKAVQKYYFRSEKLFNSHYEKHGAEFGDITQDEYLELANELINAKGDNILHKTEKEDGDFLYYNTETNEFLVLSTDGYIRTFFKPTAGLDYWERQ